MAPHKLVLRQHKIHHAGPFEAWCSCGCQGNSRPSLFSFLFEQTLWYLVRVERTNEFTNVIKALFANADRTAWPDMMETWRAAVNRNCHKSVNTLKLRRKKNLSYFQTFYSHTQYIQHSQQHRQMLSPFYCLRVGSQVRCTAVWREVRAVVG